MGDLKVRFRKEYLKMLVQKQKGREFDFRVGDVVLVVQTIKSARSGLWQR